MGGPHRLEVRVSDMVINGKCPAFVSRRFCPGRLMALTVQSQLQDSSIIV